MEGVTIISTEQYNVLINMLERTHDTVLHLAKQLEDINSKWMTTAQVCAYVKKERTWVMQHKHELGSTKRAGTLLFKRSAIDEFLGEDWFREGEKPEPLVKRPAKRRS
ncbi:helix-turn-helix domain-containing protein [Pedobacter sp. SAFR-022]